MRKFILFGLLAYASTAHAQNKSNLSVADLIESKRFVFVVHEIEKRAGLNGVSPYATNTFLNRANPSVMTIRQSYNVTSLPIHNAYQQDYYRLTKSDGSYFSVNSLNGKTIALTEEDKGKHIYLTQNGGSIMISEAKNPKSVGELQVFGDYVLAADSYKLKSSKKSDGSVKFKYTLKGNDQKQTFYLNVDKKGNAVLIQQPTDEFTTYMYGKIEAIPQKAI